MIQIRMLQPDTDLKDMAELTTALGYPCSASALLKRMNHFLADSNYMTFVATDRAQVIAYIGCIKQYAWETDGYCYRIQALVVDKNYRRKGVGKQLIEYVEKHALHHDAHSLLLNSSNLPERVAAHQFYLNLGFEIKSTAFKKILC